MIVDGGRGRGGSALLRRSPTILLMGDRCTTLTCDVSLDLDSRSAQDQPGRDGGDSAVPCNRSGTGITTIKPTRQTFNVASTISIPPSHARYASDRR